MLALNAMAELDAHCQAARKLLNDPQDDGGEPFDLDRSPRARVCLLLPTQQISAHSCSGARHGSSRCTRSEGMAAAWQGRSFSILTD